MVGLPKKYIKKYGVSKKAWAEYRKSKVKRRTTSKRKIIKRTATKRYTMARRKRRTYKRSSSKVSLKKLMIGSAITAVAEPYLDSYLIGMIRSYIPIPNGAIKALIGYYGAKKMKGYFKSASTALMVLGINDLVKSFGIGLPVSSATQNTGVIV